MSAHFPKLSAGLPALFERLQGRKIVVIGHARPDGDCIGSQVALCRVLRAKGIDALCVNPDPVPRRLQFLVGDTPFVRFEQLDAQDYDAVYVDCADLRRAGEAVKTRFAKPAGNVDHHLSNIGYGEHNFIDTAAAATGEILAGMFLDAGLEFDALTAQGLFVGIATDTGQFRFPATTGRCFEIAAELVRRGADPALAGNELYEQETFGKLQLLQRFLASFKTECDGLVCVGLLPEGSYAETGTTPEDTEGMVDYARSIEGVEIGVLIEMRDGAIKGSLRSTTPTYRMDRVAARFNGGGHACAAGLNVKGVSLEAFRAELVAAIAEEIASVKNASA